MMGSKRASWRRIRGLRLRYKLHRLLWDRRRTAGRAILFCTTNGSGVGHLTRALAVARRVREMDPDRPILFLVSTPDLSIVRKEGFPTYYVPYFQELRGQIRWERWNDYVRACALKIIDNHRISLVVFDGFLPFYGLVDALDKRRRAARVWIRRGMEKSDFRRLPDRVEGVFDFIIKPNEAGSKPRPFDGKILEVDPILSFETSSLFARDEARRRLGIPDQSTCVYVQLGSGTHFDNEPVVREVMDVLNLHESIFVVFATSTLSDRLPPHINNGIQMRNYPNFPFYRAYDFAVSAVGYNTFHELLACQVPAILIPRESRDDSEDQLARAMIAGDAGAAHVIRFQDDRDAFRAEFNQLVERLKSRAERERLQAAAASLISSTGTQAAAQFLMRAGESGSLPELESKSNRHKPRSTATRLESKLVEL